ncbi:Hypothetical protein CINCED_3A007309 [Cinara cedri]|uniref:FAS1 domain-containing protein n=1 Tax=Cinara cedri TaxID=506608 RepID=A0A5E4NG75_9HEMI|nr:Hypothetical protein CINCED_3A007309 [Cinara cedri]
MQEEVQKCGTLFPLGEQTFSYRNGRLSITGLRHRHVESVRRRAPAHAVKRPTVTGRRAHVHVTMVRGTAPSQRTSGNTDTTRSAKTTMTGGTMVITVAAVLVAVVMGTAATGVSAITTKPSADAAVIKTTLQIVPPANEQHRQLPSFAAHYWQRQRGIATMPSGSGSYDGDGEHDDDLPTPQLGTHKLSAAQQTHILDDIRRHNQQQQWWMTPDSLGTVAQPSVTNTQLTDNNEDGERQQTVSDSATDQLQQLLQINGVAATDGETIVDNLDDERHGKQRSVGVGSGTGGWQPQQSPLQFNNHNRHQHPSISPYVPPPPTATVQPTVTHQHQQKQYYPTTSPLGPLVKHHHHHQQQQQQQQQLFVTTPTSTTTPITSKNHPQQQYISPQPSLHQYYPQQQQQPAFVTSGPVTTSSGISGGDDNRGEIDADIEQQIRQQLTAVVGASGGNYTVLTSLNGHRLQQQQQQQQTTDPASNDNVQYVKIGGGGSSSPSRSRVHQQQQIETATSSVFASTGSSIAGTGSRNTIVKTVVVRQKPVAPTTPTTTQSTTTSTPAPTTAASQQQHTWTISEQQQLEQLARQVLPPGVAQYEIIRAGGVDTTVAAKNTGDVASAATVENVVPAISATPQQPAPSGKKKPVTFVILEERPDGTVRVRGIEKKQHGGDEPSEGSNAVTASSTTADDEQLQALVDKLNRGELRLPSTGSSSSSKLSGIDSATAASSTAVAPITSFVSQSTNKHRDQPSYSSTVKQHTTTVAPVQSNEYQNFFLPTAVPNSGVAVTTTTSDIIQQQKQNRYQQQQQQKQQQQFYSPPTITTLASTTTAPSNTTFPYYNNNYNNNLNNNKKEGIFSSALRRRGYYAMAKYMRQAGVDAVLEETGPFTVFVPTDKAFRALLVQLGGPDRAEDKFRENPRLLIGLLLHHVVPGAFKAADLRAGDEMTGVSLAGTQLRANLYARQLYDNRWNDIEVLTVNGARVLDDVVPATSGAAEDGFSFDDVSTISVQQRRDMVLSPNSIGTLEGSSNQQIMAIGHAVDRVLFPLPVGDVLATMRADRQRRYTVFLRVVDEYCSPSVRNLLTGPRTVTVFAPMDDAFRLRRGSINHNASGSIVNGLLHEDNENGRIKQRNRRKIADKFVLSHVVLAGPGDPPMYTAGLRFYQVRDTAYRLPDNVGVDSAAEDVDEGTTEDITDDGHDERRTLLSTGDDDKQRYYQLTVYKDSGKIRLNGGVAQVLVRNVPTTNGVLHGLDGPLV